MPATVVLILCLFPGQWPATFSSPVNHLQQVTQRMADVPPLPSPEAERRDARCAQKRFEDSLNGLRRTLADFSDKYNAHHTINVKQVKALKKAWHELEKSEPWFKGK